MEKLAIGVTVLLLLLFTQVTPERVEKKLEKVMRQAIPAKAIDVELEGSPGLPTLQGKFRKLTVRIEGLSFSGGQLLETLPIKFTDKPEKEGRIGEVHLTLSDTDYEGLRISKLQARAKTVRFDMRGSLKEKRLVLVSAASGTLIGFISADSIQRYIARYASENGVEEPQIQLRHGDMSVEGRWKVELAGVPLVRLPFSALVELFPANGNEIHWKLLRATIAEIVPLPAGWLQERFQKLNPIVRFDLAPLRVQIETVTVTPEGINISAKFALSP